MLGFEFFELHGIDCMLVKLFFVVKKCIKHGVY